jgi:teichuronic acid biosynthesis glycosyltransferase TuaG
MLPENKIQRFLSAIIVLAKDYFMPLVSIITPVHNAAQWLPETLASVGAQTLTDWEHLVVDDGSTDNSVAIIEKAATQDARIHLLHTPCNSGPAAARNLALDAVQGRFIAFLDADDLWLPNKLACQVKWMTDHNQDFTYHAYRHMSQDGLRIGALVSGPKILNMRTLHTQRGTGCLTVMIDRERIQEFSFPSISPIYPEDFCLWFLLIQKGHIGYRLSLDLARYRLLPQSRSASKLDAAANVWHLYRKFSKLPLLLAMSWWLQYTWNAFWLHRRSRPQ